MTKSPLRTHQAEAVDAAVHALEFSASSELSPEGLRAQVISACGTGKTRIAVEVAQRIAPHGRVLVVVPTLDLLTQTVAAWRASRTGVEQPTARVDGEAVQWQQRQDLPIPEMLTTVLEAGEELLVLWEATADFLDNELPRLDDDSNGMR